MRNRKQKTLTFEFLSRHYRWRSPVSNATCWRVHHHSLTPRNPDRRCGRQAPKAPSTSMRSMPSTQVNENQDTSPRPASSRAWLPRRRHRCLSCPGPILSMRWKSPDRAGTPAAMSWSMSGPASGSPLAAAPSAQLISAIIVEIESAKNKEPLPCMTCDTPHRASPSRVFSRGLG